MPDGGSTLAPGSSGPIGGRGGAPGSGGAFIAARGVPLAPRGVPAGDVQRLVSDPISPLFNIGGAPIAVLGGVFSDGLPIAGPVTQIFRGGSAPEPPTLFLATISPSGPIGDFFIGSGGSPIGTETFGGGALPIGAPAALRVAVAQIQPREALVGPAAIAFGGGRAAPVGAPPVEPRP